MSKRTREIKATAKQARFDALVAQVEHQDDKSGDEHRRAAAHAHVATHNALELDTPAAHDMAAMAHRKVAEMHEASADEMRDQFDDSGMTQVEAEPAGGKKPAPAKK